MNSIISLINSLNNKAIKEILISKNMIGQGHAKKVYKIPNSPDFVLATIKQTFDSNGTFLPFVLKQDLFNGANYGQVVAESPSGLIIMKRVPGHEYGVSDWFNKLLSFINDHNTLSPSDAFIFYKQVKNAASHPINSYKCLALQLKALAEQYIRIDSGNPNNLIIDRKRHSFCIIDFDNPQEFKADQIEYSKSINGVLDMPCLLLDVNLHTEWLALLAQKWQKDYIYQSKILIKKCYDAAIAVGLNTSPDCTISYIMKLATVVPNWNCWQQYLKFAELYNLPKTR